MAKSMQNNKTNSFVIVIKETQNDTWQGSIDWIEGKKKQYFRSALEMIKLIDSAVEKEETR